MGAQTTGAFFESLIQTHATGYEKQGRAVLEKVAPPTRTFVKFGKPITMLLPSPFLDFCGVWTEQSGMCLHIECKSTQEPRLPVAVNDGVKPTQLASLHRWHDNGAAVCVLWLHAGEVRLVTLAAIADARARGRKSLEWERAMTIKRGMGLITHDFLSSLAEVYGLT